MVKDRNSPQPGDLPGRRAGDLEGVLAEMRRGATSWPSTHRDVFEQAMDKLREALEEVQVTEDELRRQNAELSAAQLEATVARERHAELFNFAPVAHVVTDLHGDIIEANLRAAAMFGVAQEELFRKPLATFVPAGERRSFRSRLAQIAGEGQARDWTFRIKPRDDPPFEAVATVAVFRDADGQRGELRWIVQEVSDRLAAELEEAHNVSVRHRKLQAVTDVLLRHIDRKSTRLNSSHPPESRMPSSA